MEITEIKQRLTLATVLHYYGLKSDNGIGAKATLNKA